jgi:hypothetical protein
MQSSSATTVPAHIKAHATGRWAEIIFRALSARVANRWQFISFRGTRKGEWRGVVDVLAIRKDTSQLKSALIKRGDLFDIILIQIKGGSAPQPTHEDCIRLREVAKYYRAQAIIQFQWRKGVTSSFLELDRRTLKWKPTTGAAIFG